MSTLRKNKNLSTKKAVSQKLYHSIFEKTVFYFSNKKYKQLINLVEKYRKNYDVGDNLLDTLAAAYDHLAWQLIHYSGDNKKKKAEGQKHLKKAESIYKALINKNPENFNAVLGLGRILQIQGDIHGAIKYYKKAVRLRNKLPREQRGSLSVGHLYEELGDNHTAEIWYKKDVKESRKDDFGAYLNLFGFYFRNEYKKARIIAPKLRRLIQEEFSKDIYKGTNMLKSDFIKSIISNIDEVENLKNRDK